MVHSGGDRSAANVPCNHRLEGTHSSMQRENATSDPTEQLAECAHRQLARVLEQATTPDVPPASVMHNNTLLDLVQNLAEAEIARRRGALMPIDWAASVSERLLAADDLDADLLPASEAAVVG